MTTTYARTTAPTCYVCRTRECPADLEDGRVSFYSTCEKCFDVIASAPYCYHPDCSGRIGGARTRLTNPGAGITTATARYSCPNGHGTASRIGWATGSGIHAAHGDVVRRADLDLVQVRLSARGIASNYNAEHPVARAYARAYVDTAVHLLAGKPVR